MTIRACCRCGRVLEAPEEHAGSWARCPACGERLRLEDAGPDEAGRQTGPAMPCARCGHSVGAGLVICPHCSGNPHTGAAPKASVAPVRKEPVEEAGFLRLCLNMLIHPVRTADEVTYHLSRKDMLIKAGVLYVSGLIGFGLVGVVAEKTAGVIAGTLAEVTLGVVISAFFVALVGQMFAGGGSFRETLVAFGFLAGVMLWVGLGVGLVTAPALLGAGVEVRLYAILLGRTLSVWRLLLQLLIIGAIFDCGLGGAFAINLLAALLGWSTYFVGSRVLV